MTYLIYFKNDDCACQKTFAIRTDAGLENSTRPLVFMSTSGCRASENFDIFSENYFFPIYVNIFCDAGQVPIFRYFEA